VEHTQLMVPRMNSDCDREKARILVIHAAQFDAVPMSVGCEPQPLPVEEILDSAIAIVVRVVKMPAWS